MTRKTLFLDYDGVLHRGVAYVNRLGPVSSARHIKLFEFAETLEDLLRPYPEVDLVLSTSWVEEFGFERARDFLPSSPLRERVVGATFPSKETPFDELSVWLALSRGEQVLQYVSRHRLSKWLAVDDLNAGFAGHMDRLVHCQTMYGLGDPAVQQVFATRLQKHLL